ncbi:Villin headpiece domain, partial [Musa troglodytarum]
VLQTTSGKGGYGYDIHFWIGKDSSQDEAGTAAIKTVELDAVLGGRAVQHRELQGFESDKFLSYFKPCIIPLEGGFTSGFKKPEEQKFETRLYVPFARSSLNHDDVFILDTEKKIYQFNGSNSNVQERAKALEVIQHLKDKYHDGTCDVAIIDDGKLQAESDSGEFWVLFGGFAPIGKKVFTEDDLVLETAPVKIYSINGGQLKLEEDNPSKALLENNKCYLLDCGAEIFVWVGRVTQVDDRKAASKAAEDFIIDQNRPKMTCITQVIQGYETQSFKSNFESWPVGTGTGTGTSSGDEARGKVAALLKQQGVDVKGAPKGSLVSEEIPPLIEGNEKLEVWLINGSAKTPIPNEEIGKFYSGDCYIVLCTYRAGEKKEEYYLCCWIGKDSIQDDRVMSTRLCNTIWNSLKGRPVQGRVFQGKEPPQFIAFFQPMVVLKGGISSGYKKFLADKNLNDETYTSDSIALIQVSGTSVHNNKAVQVDAVAASLSSNDCFLLQSGSSVFAWHGNSSTTQQQQWAARVAEFLKFTEVFNFSQDDLLTEDMLILDTHSEVFVWVGQYVDSKEKQKAFHIGQKYIDLAVSLEGLSSDVPIYVVIEGYEPCFFTTYFSWNSAKAIAQGNSFQKKLSLLFGPVMHASESNYKANNVNHDGPTQRASALAALSSAFNPTSSTKTLAPKPSGPRQGSQRAAAVAALSSVLTAEHKRADSDTSTARISRSPSPGPRAAVTVPLRTQSVDSGLENLLESSVGKENIELDGYQSENNVVDTEATEDSNKGEPGGECTYSYERLRATSSNPVRGIDYKRREVYLSDAEFQTVFGMTKELFYQQPQWKQDVQKRKKELF